MDLWGLVGPVFAWQGLPVSGFRPAESTSDTFVLYHLPAVLAVDDYDACAGPTPRLAKAFLGVLGCFCGAEPCTTWTEFGRQCCREDDGIVQQPQDALAAPIFKLEFHY